MPSNATANAACLDHAYNAIVADWRARNLSTLRDYDAALEEYRITFAYNSGVIENAAITYHDTRDIFEQGRVRGFTGDVRTLFEIHNQKACHELLVDALLAGRPLDKELLLETHRTLTQGTYDETRWAKGERPGQFKRATYVVGARGVGEEAALVETAIDELLDQLSAATQANILTVAAFFHACFEGIHPFADGNGRCGRALMNYLLMQFEHPPIVVFNDDRLAYYGALEAWDLEADLEPLKLFLKAQAVKTWAKGAGALQ